MRRSVAMKRMALVLAAMLISPVFAACPPGGNCPCGLQDDTIKCGTWPFLHTCQTVVCSCVADLGAMVVEDGEPGAPQVLISCDAPACHAKQGNTGNSVQYSQTSGWTWSLCLGAELKLGTGALPGPEWTFKANFCMEYDTSETFTATATCESPGCQWWAKDVVETLIPKIVTIPVTYETKVDLWNVTHPDECCDLLGHDPGELWTLYYTCGTTNKTDTSYSHHYSFPMRDRTSECDYSNCPDPCDPCCPE
jgi:hypothetical protein